MNVNSNINKFIILILLIAFSSKSTFGQSIYHEDFLQFTTLLEENYAYLEIQNIDVKKIESFYETKSKEIKDDYEFIEFLEKILNELYNGHSSLNTNLANSNRLLPTGQDIFVEYINGEYIITDIKSGSGADKCGLRTGMKIIGFNNKPIEPQLLDFLPKHVSVQNKAMKEYAINMLFAGRHNVKRELSILDDKKSKIYYPDNFQSDQSANLLEIKTININTAYLKINNSLGNYDLISQFDNALDQFLYFNNLVIDLTDTPSGGNTTIARSILGRFIEETLPYQLHEFDEKKYETKRVWKEFVSPRKAKFSGNVYILVGRWTGSMGEGIAIGFDGMKRATIIGTPMAGLLGAVSNFQLKNTGIGFQIPTERLYHIDGTPREEFKPYVFTRNSIETFEVLNTLR